MGSDLYCHPFQKILMDSWSGQGRHNNYIEFTYGDV